MTAAEPKNTNVHAAGDPPDAVPAHTELFAFLPGSPKGGGCTLVGGIHSIK